MEANKVVIHFKDGTIKKGNTSDFLPNKKIFHLNILDGKIDEIDVENIKAMFFVKDHEGDKDRKREYKDVIAGGGKKVEVSFNDGETIIGYVLGYSPNRQGFIMTPADLSGNNERIFVVQTAINHVAFI
jgi:hypothetical protein